jgi:hypothetical protein
VKYVPLFCGTDEDAQAFAALSEAELKERYAQVGRWFAENRGRIGGTNQLQGPETATSVSFGPGGTVVVTDGPFLEGAVAGRRHPRQSFGLAVDGRPAAGARCRPARCALPGQAGDSGRRR